jgi:pyrophosphatase PpaX
MIKAVIFDVDGVLIDSFNANHRFLQKVFKKAGYKNLTKKEYKNMFHMSAKEVIIHFTKTKDDQEIERIFQMVKSKDEIPYPIELITTPKNLEKTIFKLSKQYRLGIVTSRVRGSTFMLPQLKKIKKYFLVEVAFENTKKHKPDPEPIIFALKKMNVLNTETVYIGDSLSDLQAAKAAGVKIINFYKFSKFSKKDLSEADGKTNDFASLPKIISSFN